VYAKIQRVEGHWCNDVCGPWSPTEEIGPWVVMATTFYDDEAEVEVSLVDFHEVEGNVLTHFDLL